MSRLFRVFIVLAFLGLSLSACSSPNVNPTVAAPTKASGAAVPPATQAPAAVTKDEGVIKIGIATPLSGQLAPYGIAHQRAFELVFEDVNAQGGVEIAGKRYKLDTIIYDGKGVQTEMIAVVEKLINSDKVKFVSVLGTPMVQAVNPITNKAGVMMFSISNPDVLKKDFPLTLNLYNDIVVGLQGGYKYLRKAYPNMKTVASLNSNDDVGSFSSRENAVNAKANGFDSAGTELYDLASTKDFTPYILRLMSKGAEFIELAGPGAGTAGDIIRQGREAGYKGVFGAWAPFSSAVVVKAAGQKNAEDFLSLYFDEPLPKPAEAFRDRFLKKYGGTFDATALIYSVVPQGIVAGLKAANSLEPNDVAKAFHNASFGFDVYSGKATFWGNKRYGIANQVAYPTAIGQMKDGVSKVVTWTELPTE